MRNTEQIGCKVQNICHYVNYRVDRHSKNAIPFFPKGYFIAFFIC
jgi:hypothetical protein